MAFIDDTLAAKDSNKVFGEYSPCVPRLRNQSSVIHTRRLPVHCVEGKSRSASIVAAWVMKHHNIGVQDAIKVPPPPTLLAIGCVPRFV